VRVLAFAFAVSVAGCGAGREPSSSVTEAIAPTAPAKPVTAAASATSAPATSEAAAARAPTSPLHLAARAKGSLDVFAVGSELVVLDRAGDGALYRRTASALEPLDWAPGLDVKLFTIATIVGRWPDVTVLFETTAKQRREDGWTMARERPAAVRSLANGGTVTLLESDPSTRPAVLVRARGKTTRLGFPAPTNPMMGLAPAIAASCARIVPRAVATIGDGVLVATAGCHRDEPARILRFEPPYDVYTDLRIPGPSATVIEQLASTEAGDV
jgi:hypothetical protein